jgi:hypothetical protein
MLQCRYAIDLVEVLIAIAISILVLLSVGANLRPTTGTELRKKAWEA